VVTDLHVFAVPGIPDVTPDADLALLVADALERSGRAIEHGDVFVVAQKIVSKAEGAVVCLADVTPSPLAAQWASAHGKDPRLVEVIFRESRRIVRMDRGILITETHHGFVCANAGVDASNVEPGFVTVLPRDSDASAERLRVGLIEATVNGSPSSDSRDADLDEGTRRAPVDGSPRCAVIISDTFGRPWREGVVNVALGVAGLRPLIDYRGCLDAYGRRLESTIVALADELAAAADIVTRKTSRTPVAVVRGAGEWLGEGSARPLVREPARDLFR
jgi:coenzyme F420-0:L-glutamate ligase/coenzyme F420-1:gamma-L-glutamate ligase